MMTKRIFPVTGMSCAACAARVSKTLGAQQGVRQAAVNFAAATVAVEYDPDRTSPELLAQAVAGAGYGLITDLKEGAEQAEREHAMHYRALKRRAAAALALAVPLLVVGMLFMHRPWSPLGDVAARHPAGLRLRARLLRRSLAPAAPPLGQHGHARGAEHGHRLRFQPLQPPLPRILDLARHRARMSISRLRAS